MDNGNKKENVETALDKLKHSKEKVRKELNFLAEATSAFADYVKTMRPVNN